MGINADWEFSAHQHGDGEFPAHQHNDVAVDHFGAGNPGLDGHGRLRKCEGPGDWSSLRILGTSRELYPFGLRSHRLAECGEPALGSVLNSFDAR